MDDDRDKQLAIPVNITASSRPRHAGWLAKRYILVILGSLGLANVYALRVNLSVAIVAMVNSTFADPNTSKDKRHECEAVNSSSIKKNDGTFKWDQDMQGIVLGAFFYGYVLTQFPGGWLTTKYGGKRVIGYGVLLGTCLTFITPLAAKFSVYALIAVRFVVGFGEGVVYPACYGIWSYWAPPLERTKLITFTFMGGTMGTIVTYPLCGWLCGLSFLGGWPLTFYIFGLLSLLWFFAWMYLVYDTPSDHSTISEEELNYIQSAVGAEQDHSTTGSQVQDHHVPWKSIFTSLPFWAIIVINFTTNWGYDTLLTTMPTYFKEVLGVHILENGLFSAVPFICCGISIFIASWLSDYVLQKDIISVGTTRRSALTTGSLITGCALIGTSFLGCHQTALAVFLLSVALVGSGLSQAGFSPNNLDIAARYAAILMSISNTVGNVAGIFSPYLVGLITNKEPTRGRWQIVFFIAAGIYAFGAIFFLVFGSGKEQEWNRPDINKELTDGSCSSPNEPLLRNTPINC